MRLLCFVALAAVALAVPVRQATEPGLVRQLFTTVDRDGDGLISAEELSAYSFRLDRENSVSAEMAQNVMAMIDANGDGSLDVNEMCEMAGDQCDDEAENLTLFSHTPQQVHLAPGATPDSVVISWVSLGKNTRSAAGSVEYSNKARNVSASVAATSGWYDCGTPTWDGTSFHATVEGLAPSTTYSYRVRTADQTSEELAFTTAAATVSQVQHYAVFGDMGTIIPLGWKVAHQILRLHKSHGFDSMIHVGDIAYAGVSSEKAKEKPFIWDLFMRQMAPIASQIPYITTVGNHEKYCNYSSFQSRFEMPGNKQPGAGGNFWFSVDRGLTHWLSFSTEHDYDAASPQGKFIDADLKAAVANRKNVPWIIVTGHRPMYSSDVDEKDQHWPGARLQATVEPYLRKYGVDLYVGGHMHCYERCHPISNNGTVDTASIKGDVYTNPNGTVHVVQGTAGVFQTEKWISPQPEWSAARMQFYGIGDVTVHNATHLQYSFKEQKDDKVVDEFWIVKSAA